MKKLAIGVLGILMLMSVSSFATQTRTMVMGDNNMIMVDDANVFAFPGRTLNYPNLAIGEFGMGDEFHNFGINWQFGDESPWVLGTYFSTMGPLVPSWLDGSAMFAWDGPLGNNRRIDLLYGRQIGGNNFGFHLEYITGGWEVDADTSGVATDVSKESLSQFWFGFGLTEGTSGKWDITLNALFGSWTNEDAQGNKEYEPDGYSDLWVEGRYFMTRNPKVTLVPHAMIGIGKRGLKMYNHGIENWQDLTAGPDPTTLDLTNKHSSISFDLGIGMNYTPGPNLLAVFDFGLMYSKIKSEGDYSVTMETDTVFSSRDWDDTEKEFVLPYFKIGFEADVFSWMDVRMGASSYWNSFTDEATGPTRVAPAMPSYTTTTKIGSAVNDTYLGFGFHWGRLYVDTYTDPEIFLNGFQFITGAGIDGRTEMNFQISVLYELF